MTRVLRFRLPDQRRLRALFTDPAPVADRPADAVPRNPLTHRGLERAGLARDEIRLVGGYRGLSAVQQQAVLA